MAEARIERKRDDFPRSDEDYRPPGSYPKTGVMSGLATNRKLYVVAHLDSLLEGRYPRLECLPKGGMSGSNCCRAPWTC
jgi:hypothetical protein